jgi:hypothetical protein
MADGGVDSAYSGEKHDFFSGMASYLISDIDTHFLRQRLVPERWLNHRM